MGNKYKQLRQFNSEELILNEEETRIVLKFIFKPTDHELIDSLPMSDYLRGFAQGLLLEAIDASYAVGYVKGLFRSTANPTKGAISVLKSFGKKAARHWFKHASRRDLRDVKIYDFVRNFIAERFRFKLQDFLAQKELDKHTGASLAYKKPSQGRLKVWG